MSDASWLLKDESTGAMLRLWGVKQADDRVLVRVGGIKSGQAYVEFSFADGVLTITSTVDVQVRSLHKTIYNTEITKDAE